MSQRHWAQIGEVTFATGIRLLFLVQRWFGRWPFRFFVYPTVFVYMLRYPEARAASRAYLQRALARADGTSVSVGWGLMLRHFATFAESILDKLRIWSGALRYEDCVLHDYHHITDLKASGSGAVLVVSHLGNAEICRALSTRSASTRMTVLVHTRHAEAFNALLAEFNPKSRLDLLQVTELTAETAMQLQHKVEQGGFVVIAGDRVPVAARPRVATTEFLGADAPFPVGPWVLGSLLHCPVLLVFCIAQQGRYHVYFERFRDEIALPRASRDLELRQLVTDYAARLAHYCRLAPMQWFNFYDFWALTSTVSIDAPR